MSKPKLVIVNRPIISQDTQCTFTIKNGNRCSRKTKNNTSFCSQHTKKDNCIVENNVNDENTVNNINYENKTNTAKTPKLKIVSSFLSAENFKPEPTKCLKQSCKFCSIGNIEKCFNKSFASHYRSQYWSKDNLITPRDITKGSDKKCIFKCNICLHDFKKRLANVTSHNGWCPYCSIPIKNLCTNNSCNFCYNNSFASHIKSKYWSEENILKPRQISKSSKAIQKFNCDICYHIFEASVDHITCGNTWCPYCANQKLCYDILCKICFEKSFETNFYKIYWSNKNLENPRNVFKSSNKKYIFDCPMCNNEYEALLSSVSNGTWCSCKKYKTSEKLYNFLTKNFNLNISKEKKFEWCKNITYLPFDFCIEDLKIIIELDGRQHFFQVQNWLCPEESQKWDKYKMNCANLNGYSVIRIFQENVFFDKENWQTKLKDAIKKYDTPTNIMIGNIYKDFSIYSS